MRINIFESPEKLVGKIIHVNGKTSCRDCEWFDNLSSCPGAGNAERCPENEQIIYVRTINVSWWDTGDSLCIINTGELTVPKDSKTIVTMEAQGPHE